MTRNLGPPTAGWLGTALVGAPVRVIAVIAGLASLALVHSTHAAAAARGSLAGKVFDKQTEALVPNVTIDAYALTSGEEFHVVTDAGGGYVVDNAPTSVYSFTLRAGGTDYVVQERLDLRVGMPFLLESCFELDGETNTAHVLEECDSGLVEEARVATIGPHRFLKPQDIPRHDPEGQPAEDGIVEPDPEGSHTDQEPDPTDEQPGQLDLAAEDSDFADSSMAMPEAIAHDELECLTYDHYPLVDANIAPGRHDPDLAGLLPLGHAAAQSAPVKPRARLPDAGRDRCRCRQLQWLRSMDRGPTALAEKNTPRPRRRQRQASLP